MYKEETKFDEDQSVMTKFKAYWTILMKNEYFKFKFFLFWKREKKRNLIIN